MGIFGRIWNKIRRKGPAETEMNRADSIASAPMPSSPPFQTSPLPSEGPEGDFQKEDFGLKGGSEPEEVIRLPVKRHILKEIEDPFTQKEKSMIFQENLDLIALFRKGEFSERETLRMQQSAIITRLKDKRIGPDQAKGVLDDYRYYFRKELEEAKRIKKAKEEAVAG